MTTMNSLPISLRGLAAAPGHVRIAATAISLAFVQAVFPILVPGHNAQRLMQLVLFAVLGLWCLAGSRIDASTRVTRYWRPVPIGLFFVLGAVSAAFALYPRHAFVELAILFMLLVVASRIAHEIEQ